MAEELRRRQQLIQFNQNGPTQQGPWGLQEPGADPGSLMTPFHGDFIDNSDYPIQPDFSNAFDAANAKPWLRFPEPETPWNSGHQLTPADPNGPNGQLLPVAPYDRGNTGSGYRAPYPMSAALGQANEPPPYPDLGIRSPGPNVRQGGLEQQQATLRAAQQIAGHFGAINREGVKNQIRGNLSNVYVADFPNEQAALAEAQMRADHGVPNVRLHYPNENQTPAQGFAQGAAQLGGVLNKTLGATVPGLPQVQSAVSTGLEHAVLPMPTDFIPGLDTRPIRQAAARFIGEAIIPTHVWDTALTLFPAAKARTPIELVSSLLLGDTGALDALRGAGRKLGESEAVEKGIARLGEEQGALKLGGGKPAETLTADQIAHLQEQRANITKAIGVLNGGEQRRVLNGGLGDVMRVATRYEAGSEQRAALLTAAEPLIAHLPEVDQKFIKASIETLPSRAARKAATEAQRARQFSSAAEAFDSTEGTIAEKAAASFRAKGGKQAQQFTPIGDRFSDQETADLMQRIVDAADSGKIGRVFDRDNAISAMSLLTTGERIPGVRSEALKALNLAPHEISLLGKVFGPEFEQAIPKSAEHMSGFQRFIDVLNLPRALITAIDISAAGRQGILLAARNPLEVGKSLRPMFKAMSSEEGFQRAAQNIQRNKRFEDGLVHGLQITDIGGGVAGEEPFISRFAQAIRPVRASERGFVMYLDTLRMLTYEKYADRAERLATKQKWGVERLDLMKSNVAKFLNHASGRGDLGALGEWAPAANAVFFAPRFFFSRFQSVWDMVRPGADSFSRQVAFENLGAFVGTGIGLLETAKLMGADVEIDPRSSDFGRMKFGNTRIDFWGGYQPLARYIAQMASAHVKNPSTQSTGFVNPGDTALRFFRSKLSPAGATIYDYLPGKQKDYQGNDLLIPFSDLTANHGLNKDAGALAWNTFATKILPLSIQDAISGFQASGWKGSLAAGGVSAVGGGVSSYEPTEKQQKTVVKNQLSGELEQAGFPTRDRNYEQQSFRDALSHSFDVQDMPRTYDEFRTNWIDQQVKTGVPRSEAIRRFNLNPLVKGLDSQIEKATLGFWKAHPDLLQRAIDSGATDSSAEKQKILADAHH